MSWTFFKHLWRSQRAKLLIVSVAIFGWSTFLPVIYQSFGSQMKALIDSGVIPKQFTSFGGGDVFSLGGSIALGYIHPISIILVSIFAIGLTTSAVAGERQGGCSSASSCSSGSSWRRRSRGRSSGRPHRACSASWPPSGSRCCGSTAC